MNEYEIKDVVCDYGIYQNDQLILILNDRKNAQLIKSILENDDLKTSINSNEIKE